MVYPKFKEKHLQKAIINPSKVIVYEKHPKNLPKKYIIVYYKRAADYFRRKYKAHKSKKVKLSRNAYFYRYKDLALIYMTGIGAPHAVNVVEDLIALGGKEFLSIGYAGGLHHEGVFLCDKALRDEGTSYHYLPHGHFTYPDEKLTEKLGKFIEKQGLEFFEGTTWTIDAPYRETRAEVERYAKKGVVTVEMEASALFAVAKYRKVKMASAFVVSDLLGGKEWEPKFHEFNVKKTLYKLIDAAVECLRGK